MHGKGLLEMKIHIAQEGETLTILADKYGVDYEQLIAANPQIASPDMIMPSMKIKIPSDSYKVKTEQQQSDKALTNNKAVGQKMSQNMKGHVIGKKQKKKSQKLNAGRKDSLLEKKEKKKSPEQMTTLESNLTYYAFTPHKRMETEMQMDMERQSKQLKDIIHTPLHKGNDIKEEKDFCCFHCHQPMEMERPLYFPMNHTTKESEHSYPHLPANLSKAKPNDFLS